MFDRSKMAANMTSFVELVKNSEYDLQSDVFNLGPISIIINAQLKSFQLYGGGTCPCCRCF